MRDYYEILGVERGTEAAEIKKAYRRLAMQYHPDRNPGDAEAESRFKEAAEAYEVLSNEDTRARYDRFGHAGVRGNGAGGGFQDINDIFSAFSDIFGGGSMFDDVFGGSRTRARTRGAGRSGGDLRIKLPLTLEEIAIGVEKKIKVKKYVACKACDGSGAEGGAASYTSCRTCGGAGEVRQAARTVFGQFVTVQPCPTCHGEGRIVEQRCNECTGEGRIKGEETLPVNVPPGVLEGHYLSLRGAGNAGLRGGPAGDLRVEIAEIPHEHFVREGLDVYYDLHLPLPDAVLGTEVDVPTLEGFATIGIDPGAQSGRILRMKAKGLPDVNTGRFGDEMVRLHVWTPQRLTDDERAAFERMRNSPSFEPQPELEPERKSFFSRVKDVFS
jgi:molecular chaperone DnaJ